MQQQSTETVLKRTFAALSKNYSIQEKDILVVFTWGSRLFGTANKNSDHDLFIIHDAPAPNSEKRFGASVASGIDVRVESVSSMTEQLKKVHDVFAWLAILLPSSSSSPCFILYEQQSEKMNWKTTRSRMLQKDVRALDPAGLTSKLDENLKADEARVLKMLEHQDPVKAQKIAIHSFRLVWAAKLILKLFLPLSNSCQQQHQQKLFLDADDILEIQNQVLLFFSGRDIASEANTLYEDMRKALHG